MYARSAGACPLCTVAKNHSFRVDVDESKVPTLLGDSENNTRSNQTLIHLDI